jgi:large subunit ribosomal protein L13
VNRANQWHKKIKTVNTLSYKTVSANSATVQKGWVVVDAENQVLGRVCSEIAKIIRGKHKASYTPHVDCGDNVIVINAEKVRLTGKKMDDKVYIRHTGYPGGQRFRTPRELLTKNPIGVVESAVRGMLPKNRLGRKLFTNLYVYAGNQHPHEAQQPVELKF